MDKEINTKSELIGIGEIEIKKKTILIPDDDIEDDDEDETTTCGRKEKTEIKKVIKDKSKCIKCKTNKSNYFLRAEIICK